ncbi:MAG: thiamine diphosphokinase [Hyphomicrobiales bacterium]
MEGTRALVFANGDLPSAELVAEFQAGAALVVAADGGADKALAVGVTPDVVIGDLDSVSEDARQKLPAERFLQVVDYDTTDLQKAVVYCIGHGATRIDILAAGGGRADHALANLSLVAMYRDHADVRVVDDRFEVSLVRGTTVIEAPRHTVISLVAVGQCEGVTTTGMRWNLTDYPLAFSPYGVHNEVAETPASVSVRSGDLLLFRGRWLEPNRDILPRGNRVLPPQTPPGAVR